MAKNSTFVEDLRVLYETYPGQVVADAIGVTIRQIQNYLKEVEPATPSVAVGLRIREAFARHSAGLPIQPPKNEGLQEELMQSYKDQIELLKGRVSSLTDKIKEAAIVNRAILLTNQDLLIEVLAHLKKRPQKEVFFEASKANRLNFDRALKMDNHESAGK